MLKFNKRDNMILSKKFKNRIYDLKKFNSEYFINLIEFFESKDKFYIITELCNIDLEAYLSKNKIKLEKEQIINIFNSLNKALNDLINNQKFNIDIKLKNILININDNNNKEITLKTNLYGLKNLLIDYDLSFNINNISNSYLIEHSSDITLKMKKVAFLKI